MPVWTFDDVMNNAAALLNDSAQNVYTNSVLTPFFRKAYTELVDKLDLIGAPVIREQTAVLTIPANTTRLATSGTVPTIPTDMSLPLEMKERPTGSSINIIYRTMIQKPWEPDIVPGVNLDYWIWRENEIKLPGATQSIDAIISYLKDLPIPTTGLALGITPAYVYLSTRTAELAASKIMEDKDRALDLKVDAREAMDKIESYAILGMQNNPVRRKPYRRR